MNNKITTNSPSEEEILDSIFYTHPRPVKQLNDFTPFSDFLTVGQLRKRIEDLPDDTPVLIERVEDCYFEKHGWHTTNFIFPFSDEQKFFQAWGVSSTLGKVLIHAHY